MVEEILKRYFPSDWNGINKNVKYSKHYEEIHIDGTVDSMELRLAMIGGFCKKIKRITRVENPYFYGCFLLKQAEYKSKGISFTIKNLYHDTAEHKIDSILKTNLDWRLVNRNKFGDGVSFSSDVAYANRQSSRSNGISRAMIVADVLCGNSHGGSASHRLPHDGYDTTVGNKCVYVKFYDNEFYPKYVIYYDSIEHVQRRRFWF